MVKPHKTINYPFRTLVERDSVYDTHKYGCDKLEADGFKNIVGMCKYFSTVAEMDRALGFSGAVSNWVNGGNSPSRASELSAARWLEMNAICAQKAADEAADEAARRVEKKELPQAVTQKSDSALSETDDTAMFLFVAPCDKADKLRKIFFLMGIEMVEV